jgi:hypothetical protein
MKDRWTHSGRERTTERTGRGTRSVRRGPRHLTHSNSYVSRVRGSTNRPTPRRRKLTTCCSNASWSHTIRRRLCCRSRSVPATHSRKHATGGERTGSVATPQEGPTSHRIPAASVRRSSTTRCSASTKVETDARGIDSKLGPQRITASRTPGPAARWCRDDTSAGSRNVLRTAGTG